METAANSATFCSRITVLNCYFSWNNLKLLAKITVLMIPTMLFNSSNHVGLHFGLIVYFFGTKIQSFVLVQNLNKAKQSYDYLKNQSSNLNLHEIYNSRIQIVLISTSKPICILVIKTTSIIFEFTRGDNYRSFNILL